MDIHKISNDNKATYSIFVAKDVEFSDPIEYFKECFILPQISIERDLIKAHYSFPDEELYRFLYNKKLREWQVKYEEIMATQLQPNLISLLQSGSKKDQVRLLKNQTLTHDQLITFIFRAWVDFGFSFSTFSTEHYHNGIELSELPKLIHVKDNSVEKIGKSKLSDGQLKQLVAHRKVVVAKFLDNGNNWHCLFITYKSLRKEESWKNGQPHFHYISDKFGLDRETVAQQLKSKYYHFSSLPHIDLISQ